MVLSADPITILQGQGWTVDDIESAGLQRKNGRLVPVDRPDRDSEWGWKIGPIDPVNGLGVRIGMTKAQVEKIAGRPTLRLYSKKHNCDELVYYRTSNSRDQRGRIEVIEGQKLKVRLANYYLFRNGRVFYMEASQDLLNGG